MSEAILQVEERGAIATLTLNNPAKMNVLSEAMMAALTGAFDSLSKRADIRVVILRANGKGFCAGHDLREMTAARQAEDGGAAYFGALFQTCSAMMSAIRALPQPVIAEVQGMATAAGCQLVASCDLAIASRAAKFGVNGVNIGLFCSTPMVALSRNIGTKKAFEMLVTGDFLSPDEALQHGLVNRVVEPDALEAETQALAAQIAGKLGAAVKLGKQAYYAQGEMELAAAYEYVGEVMVENMLYAQTEAGIDAFLNKKAPDWDQ